MSSSYGLGQKIQIAQAAKTRLQNKGVYTPPVVNPAPILGPKPGDLANPMKKKNMGY